MKLTTEQVKTKLAAFLSNEGVTLEQFEVALAKQAELSKQAGPEVAGGLMKTVGSLLPKTLVAAKGIGLAGGAGLAALGGIGGLGAYGLYKQLGDSDNRIDARLVEKKQYEDAIKQLEQQVAARQRGGMM